jgi:hypothetical protein
LESTLTLPIGGGRVLSTLTGRGDPSEVMTAGLLHNIGFLVMGVLDRRTLDRTLDLARRKNISCPEAEALVGGVTHSEWGMAAADHWGLCDTITNAAGYHHLPHEDTSPTSDITAIVHVSCGLASAQMISVSGGLRGHPIDEQIRESLGLPEAQLTEIRKLMASESHATAKAFGLARIGHGVPALAAYCDVGRPGGRTSGPFHPPFARELPLPRV